MTYVLVALVLGLLASGLAVAIWVSRLKDQAFHWMTLHARVAGELSRQEARADQYLAQRRRAEAQLAALRKDYDELLQSLESGVSGDADGIAALFRRVPAQGARWRASSLLRFSTACCMPGIRPWRWRMER